MSERLYVRIYSYYRDLIEEGKMKAGEKLPSIRRLSEQLSVSRTTAEAAYLLLSADGYVTARPNSGYYVADRPGTKASDRRSAPEEALKGQKAIYDFSAAAVDPEGFRLDLWRRYVKSVLRRDERLYTYGEPQGELQLRQELCAYAARSRNIHCLPEDIVVGAGLQCLLQILCPLLPPGTVSLPNPFFPQSRRIFEDFGFTAEYRRKDADVIYVSPSRMTRWGSVMSVERRLALLKTAGENGSLIIEDDYESEFVPAGERAPALHSLARGRGVVYLGTFSRLLLPSIRLGYMILPEELARAYRRRAREYNQTASKTEQLALARFIGDGHLEAQARRLRRLYEARTAGQEAALRKVFADSRVTVREGSLCVVLTLEGEDGGKNKPRYVTEDEETGRIAGQLLSAGIRTDGVQRDRDGRIRIVLSSLSCPLDRLDEACQALAGALNQSFREKA